MIDGTKAIDREHTGRFPNISWEMLRGQQLHTSHLLFRLKTGGFRRDLVILLRRASGVCTASTGVDLVNQVKHNPDLGAETIVSPSTG